jgi:hypothetical protein
VIEQYSTKTAVTIHTPKSPKTSFGIEASPYTQKSIDCNKIPRIDEIQIPYRTSRGNMDLADHYKLQAANYKVQHGR